MSKDNCDYFCPRQEAKGLERVPSVQPEKTCSYAIMFTLLSDWPYFKVSPATTKIKGGSKKSQTQISSPVNEPRNIVPLNSSAVDQQAESSITPDSFDPVTFIRRKPRKTPQTKAANFSGSIRSVTNLRLVTSKTDSPSELVQIRNLEGRLTNLRLGINLEHVKSVLRYSQRTPSDRALGQASCLSQVLQAH